MESLLSIGYFSFSKVRAFEEEFDLEIPDEKAEKIRTVGDAVKMLDEELK